MTSLKARAATAAAEPMASSLSKIFSDLKHRDVAVRTAAAVDLRLYVSNKKKKKTNSTVALTHCSSSFFFFCFFFYSSCLLFFFLFFTLDHAGVAAARQR